METGLQAGMIWIVGLQNDLTWQVCAPCTACHLGQQLGHSLLAAKVGAEQHGVGVNHGDQAHCREVVALGQHLRPEQNAGLVAVDLGDQFPHRVLALHGIAINPENRPLGKALAQEVFYLFGAQASRDQAAAMAVRAFPRHAMGCRAVVTAQSVLPAVHG